jgi:predicted transporter
MKYLLIYIWKLIYLAIGIVIVVGTLILGMKISKMLTDFMVLQLIMAMTMWIGGSFILLKPLTMLDKILENKASLDKDARLNFFLFVSFVLISVAVFIASIYLFKEWQELISDTMNRTLDDYFTIIFPLVLLIASIGSLMGSFKLYKKYKETIKEKETL